LVILAGLSSSKSAKNHKDEGKETGASERRRLPLSFKEQRAKVLWIFSEGE